MQSRHSSGSRTGPGASPGSRSRTVRIIGCSLFLVGAGCPDSGASRSQGMPNIIFIKTDDQRADHLGCAGHPVLETPNIDLLAARGVTFTRAFATSPTCVPSRASFMLGQWQRRHGLGFSSAKRMTREQFDGSWQMVLKQHGYYTGYVGKYHCSGIEHIRNFDFWFGNEGHLMFRPKETFRASLEEGSAYYAAEATTQLEMLTEAVLHFLEGDPEFTRRAEAIGGVAEFLRSRPLDRPFCLSINPNLPHNAALAEMSANGRRSDPEPYRLTYRDRWREFAMPAFFVEASRVMTPKIPRSIFAGEYTESYDLTRTEHDNREQMIRKCQAITGIDMMVGALCAKLGELGLLDDTIIVFASDHGIQLGEHGLRGKAVLYEPSIRIPLIVCDPRLPAALRGRSVEDLAASVDVPATLLDLAGVSVPPVMQGRSLRPILHDQPAQWRDDLFCENLFTGQGYPPSIAVRGRRFKYIAWYRPRPGGFSEHLELPLDGVPPDHEELYDLLDDPGEAVDLAPLPAYAATLQSLRARSRELAAEAAGR